MKLSVLTLIALLTAVNAATLHKSENLPTSFKQEEGRLNIAKRGINDMLDYKEGSKDFNRFMSEYADCYKATLELFDNGKLNMDKFVDNREKLVQKMEKLRYVRDNVWAREKKYQESNEFFEVNKFYDIYSGMVSFLNSALDSKAAEPYDREINETVERAMKLGLEMMKYFNYDGKPIKSSSDWTWRREEVVDEIVALEKVFKRKQDNFEIERVWYMKTLMPQLFFKAEEKYYEIKNLKWSIPSYGVNRLRRHFNLWIRSFFNGMDFNQENFNSAVERVKIIGEELERKMGKESQENKDMFHALKRSVDKLEEEQKKLQECTNETEKKLRETHVHILVNILAFARVYDLDGREPSHTVDWSRVYKQSHHDVLWVGQRIKSWEVKGMECDAITESLEILKRRYSETYYKLPLPDYI